MFPLVDHIHYKSLNLQFPVQQVIAHVPIAAASQVQDLVRRYLRDLVVVVAEPLLAGVVYPRHVVPAIGKPSLVR